MVLYKQFGKLVAFSRQLRGASIWPNPLSPPVSWIGAQSVNKKHTGRFVNLHDAKFAQ